MALQRVDLVDYSRNLLQNNDVCSICLENSKEDNGKLWVAHLNVNCTDETKKTHLIHPIHRDCVKLTFEISKFCLFRDVELNLTRTQEDINAQLLEDLKAERIIRIANIGENLSKVTEKIVILVGMIGIFLLINYALPVNYPLPGEIEFGHGIIVMTMLVPLLNENGRSLKELVCIHSVMAIVLACISQSVPKESEHLRRVAILSLAFGMTGVMVARRVGIFAGNHIRNGVNLLGNRLVR